MKYFLYAIVFFGLISCGTKKNQTTETAESIPPPPQTEEITNNYRIVGTVHVPEEGCPFYIDAQMKDKKIVKMYPVNLDERFRKEGMRLKFDFKRSRAPQPEGCDAEMTVSVVDVTPLRGN